MELTVGDVKRLLGALVGYRATEDDDALIELALEERVGYVLNFCNRSDVPARLKPQVLRMAVGEFLCQRLAMGSLDLESIGVSDAPLVASTTVDDTTVSFATNGEASPLAAFTEYARRLRDGDRTILQEFRRLRW